VDDNARIVKTQGNLFDKELLDKLFHVLFCPVILSIFDEIKKLTKDNPGIHIPAVNLSSKYINGYFHYFFKRESNGLILWVIKDQTAETNYKLIRLQPEMEKKLKRETERFLLSRRNCNYTDE